jgi:hypothetical protein
MGIIATCRFTFHFLRIALRARENPVSSSKGASILLLINDQLETGAYYPS